jgi:hypothetical protein
VLQQVVHRQSAALRLGLAWDECMPGYAYAIRAAGWVIWGTPFLLVRRRTKQPKEMVRRARWGIVFVAVAYSSDHWPDNVSRMIS